jgi:hypothetical protein
VSIPAPAAENALARALGRIPGTGHRRNTKDISFGQHSAISGAFRGFCAIMIPQVRKCAPPACRTQGLMQSGEHFLVE